MALGVDLVNVGDYRHRLCKGEGKIRWVESGGKPWPADHLWQVVSPLHSPAQCPSPHLVIRGPSEWEGVCMCVCGAVAA